MKTNCQYMEGINSNLSRERKQPIPLNRALEVSGARLQEEVPVKIKNGESANIGLLPSHYNNIHEDNVGYTPSRLSGEVSGCKTFVTVINNIDGTQTIKTPNGEKQEELGVWFGGKKMIKIDNIITIPKNIGTEEENTLKINLGGNKILSVKKDRQGNLIIEVKAIKDEVEDGIEVAPYSVNERPRILNFIKKGENEVAIQYVFGIDPKPTQTTKDKDLYPPERQLGMKIEPRANLWFLGMPAKQIKNYPDVSFSLTRDYKGQFIVLEAHADIEIFLKDKNERLKLSNGSTVNLDNGKVAYLMIGNVRHIIKVIKDPVNPNINQVVAEIVSRMEKTE